MRRLIVLVVFALLVTGQASAQEPTPTPTPDPGDAVYTLDSGEEFVVTYTMSFGEQKIALALGALCVVSVVQFLYSVLVQAWFISRLMARIEAIEKWSAMSVSERKKQKRFEDDELF